MPGRGVLRCALAAVLFGVSTPLAAELVGDVSTLVLAGLLYLGAALAMAPSVMRAPPQIAAVRSDWRPLGLAVVLGGVVGPALLVAGLGRTSAASASLMLNFELVATVVLAAMVFREHLGRSMVLAVTLISAAGVLLVWSPTLGLSSGAVLVALACVCWGVDNNVTAGIDQLSPQQVTLVKGVVGGTTNLVLGLALGGTSLPSAGNIAMALLIGALGYGVSITLWVQGARDLGAARGQVIFSTAPFLGAGLAWVLAESPVTIVQIVAAVLAGVGVLFSLRSGHDHEHWHEVQFHDHEHVHDDGHHDHHHEDGFTGRHVHPHRHEAVRHRHHHVPDLHHRHDHE